MNAAVRSDVAWSIRRKGGHSSGAVSLATLKLYTRAVLPLAILVLRATVSGSDVPSPDMISTVHRAADDWCYLLVPLRIGAQSQSTSVGT